MSLKCKCFLSGFAFRNTAFFSIEKNTSFVSSTPSVCHFDPTFISHFCLYWVLPDTDFPQFLLIRDPGTKIRVLRENIVRNTNFPGGESSGLWREGRGVGQVPSLLLLGGLERRDGAPDLAPL